MSERKVAASAAEEEEEEILDILDFTAQSPWEVFTATLERILREWSAPSEASSQQHLASDPIDIPLSSSTKATLIRNSPDTTATSTDEPWGDTSGPLSGSGGVSGGASVARLWFGLKDFVALVPSDGSVDVHGAMLLLSSLSSSSVDAGVSLPLIVQFGPSESPEFIGCRLPSLGKAHMTHYATELVKAAPERLMFLDGLFPLALSKFVSRSLMNCLGNIHMPDCANQNAISPLTTHVDVRFTYLVADWAMGEWGNMDTAVGGIDRGKRGLVFMWGPQEDPISGIQLALHWSHKQPLEDSVGFSEYDPASASRWFLHCSFTPGARCFLSRSLRVLFLSLIDALPFKSMSQIISTARGGQQPNQTVLSFANSFNVAGIPTQQGISELLDSVFRVASAASEGNARPQRDSADGELLKAAPRSSLLESLSLSLLCVRGLSGYLVVWMEFVRRLRSYVEGGQLIPGVGLKPDIGDCLISQKLCMLNYATKFSKIAKPQSDPKSSPRKTQSSGLFDYDSSVDDECGDGSSDAAWGIELPSDLTPKHPPPRSSVDDTLLISGVPRVVPELQEVGVKTEDMLQELEELLVQVGSGREASVLRARLQAPQLLSDMQAFKAANEGCLLEDFVRWYSPSDWIGDRKSGHLSARMASPDTIWRVIWDEAKPIDVHHQPPLFDKGKEIAKAMHYLETIPPTELIEQIITVSLTGILRLFSDPSLSCWELFPEMKGCGATAVQRAVSSLREAIRLSWLGCPPGSLTAAREYENVWQAVAAVELASSRVSSLSRKLGVGCDRVACELADSGKCHLDNFEERSASVSLVSGSDSLPPPDVREYIVEAYSGTHGQCGSCRLYAFVAPHEMNNPDAVRIATNTSNEFG